MKKTILFTAIIMIMFIFSAISINCTMAQNHLTQIEKASYVDPQEKLINLSDPANGGEVITASKTEFQNLINSDLEKLRANKVGAVDIPLNSEMVVGFKNGKAAVIEKFTWWIPVANNYNLKEVELMVSNESVSSGFKSIGKFSPQDIVYIKNPYQEYNFTPVKARFLKLKFSGCYGCSSSFYGYSFQVFGKLVSSGQ